jgi:hypothetical protein
MSMNDRAMSKAAERQMQNWALDMQMQQRVASEREHTEVKELIHPYIAISRETGVDAASLSRAVAEKCGWKLFDRELLDYLAEHDHLSRLALEFVDERSVSWFHEMFGTWLEKQLVSQAEYVSRLGKVLLLATQHENTVIVGRGAQFMLPRERGLAVRVIAPLKLRVRNIMELRQLSEREAMDFIESTDRDREHFVHRYFQHDVSDPHLYDLMINLSHIPREDAVNYIVSEAKRHAQRLVAATELETVTH